LTFDFLNALTFANKQTVMALARKLAISYIRTRFKLLASLSKKKAAEKAFTLFCTPQHRNTKPLPAIFQQAEPLSFSMEGETVFGFRWNPESEKKVLILHGFESSVVNFERYIKPLMKKGYQVLAFDAPAHGRSSGTTINVLEYRAFVLKLLELYGPAQSFITHSFGGLALGLVLEKLPPDPERRVVFIAPATETTTAIDHFFHLLQLDDEVRTEFDQLIENKGGHHPSWFSLNRAAATIKDPVLFLQDEDDDMTPIKDVYPMMEKNYPNFRFVISKGLGHRRIYRDNASFKAIIDFL
jgi:pimeloyl-ACP methyl ester carboxylesterase